MGLIQFVIKLVLGLGAIILSIGAFLVSAVIGVLALMAVIGGGILALVTFGIIDYRKNKKTPPAEEL